METAAATAPEPQPEQAKRYQVIHYWLVLVNFVYALSFLLVMLLSGASVALRELAFANFAGPTLADAAYAFAFIAIMTVVFLPLSLYSGYLLEHRFALSNQTFIGWLWDEVKGFIISAIIGVPLILAAYLLLARFHDWWWLYAAILWTAFSFLLAYIAPVVISPLFNKFEPIADEELRREIMGLANRAGVRVTDVLRTDMSRRTKKANAYFTGLGNTKRIVLGDTLLDNYSQREVLAVVGHEMGHWKLGHLWKETAFTIVGSLVGFYLVDLVLKRSFAYFGLRDITDIAGLPLVALVFMVLIMLGMPSMNAMSRRFERQADRFELHLVADPEATISTFTKLGRQNLADPSPHPLIEWLLYSHPSIQKRIAMAREFSRQQGDSSRRRRSE